jgi:hypothetical protein
LEAAPLQKPSNADMEAEESDPNPAMASAASGSKAIKIPANSEPDPEASMGSGRMSIADVEEDVVNVTDDSDPGDSEDEDLSDDEDQDGDYDIYYGGENEDLDDGRGGLSGIGTGSQFNNNDDPEYFAYECLTLIQVKEHLMEAITTVCSTIQVCLHFWWRKKSATWFHGIFECF